MLLVFRCFTNKLVLFGLLKAKQSILVSKIILTDPYVTSKDLQGRKPYQLGVHVSSSSTSSRLCSMPALVSIQKDRFNYEAKLTEISLFNVLAKSTSRKS